jgi:hypothetical protein
MTVVPPGVYVSEAGAICGRLARCVKDRPRKKLISQLPSLPTERIRREAGG